MAALGAVGPADGIVFSAPLTDGLQHSLLATFCDFDVLSLNPLTPADYFGTSNATVDECQKVLPPGLLLTALKRWRTIVQRYH